MIRNATPADLQQIYDIYRSCSINRNSLSNVQYSDEINKKGFLLGRENAESLRELLEEAYLFLVYEENDQIGGYLIVDHKKEFHDNENKIWFDQAAKQIYYQDPQAMTIESMAVSNQHLHKGIGSELLHYLQDELKQSNYKYLFSIISLTPVRNDPSINFHKKHKFKKIGESKPRTLFEIENYSAALYFKELESSLK